MPLAAGTRIGCYEVVAAIGAGGMGEVYRAHDRTLNRDVALKILPAAFARDPDRVARLRREAQVLASLNHPNIGSIYGFEDGPAQALVMELVDGPTLTDMIAPGLSLADALNLARQIADALQAAHEHGVVHRDLKPGNIKVTPDGSVKVLDFGLAKALGAEPGGAEPTDSPTITSAGTRQGVILGTAAYMSPEQARGRPVDKRTDIWAFGCVLFEMLARRPAFEGDNVTDLLAGIVGRDPDFRALPTGTPPSIRRLLHRCLEKDFKRRLADIADARLDIDDALAAPASVDAAVTPSRAGVRSTWLAAAALTLAMVAGGASAYLWLAPAQPAPRPMQFVIAPPATDPLYTESIGAQIAISPDGQYIVYVGIHGSLQIYARRIDQLEALPIAGTQGARQPFFSPDSKSLGFWASAEGEIRRVALSGGPVSTICKAPSGNLYGASWGPGDTIVFGSGNLYRVSAAGGTPEVLTTPDAAQGEAEHRWPEILPDGRAVLFTAWGGSLDRSRIAARSLVTGERKPLIEGATTPRYSPTGHLIYYQTGSLMAARFDAKRLEVAADHVPLQEPVKMTVSGAADYALSRDGTLVLMPGTATPERKLVWVDRKGNAAPLLDDAEDYWTPRLSPDGTRLAVGIGADIWVIELARLTRNRVTYGTTSTLFPYAWSRDGSRVVFSKVENKVGLDLYTSPADGTGQPELLSKGEYRQWATSSSSASDVIAVYEQHPTTLRDIWLLAPDGHRAMFLVTPYQERAPRFSPDGHWIAYVSNDSGRDEVYVRSASGDGGKTTVSTEGGSEPMWAAGGREIFYRNGDRLMIAAVETVPALHVGRPGALFQVAYERDRGSGTANPNYDVTRDGQRFIMIQPPASSANIVVVLNWFEDLKARMASGRR
jgi:serine/threonine-protein kinase